MDAVGGSGWLLANRISANKAGFNSAGLPEIAAAKIFLEPDIQTDKQVAAAHFFDF